MQNLRKLLVWKQGIEIAIKTYQLTETLPSKEKFGLTSQMTRAAVSIPSNIAEGSGRKSAKEFHHYLQIALGSAFELETQVIVAGRLNLISQEQKDQLQQLIVDEQKMINGLVRRGRVATM